MDPAYIAFVQAGGVLAFAGLVWFELRTQRKTIEKIGAHIAELRTYERIRRGDTGPIALPRTISDDDVTPRSRRDS